MNEAEDIVYGDAVVVGATYTDSNGIAIPGWALPGGTITHDRAVAEQTVKAMHNVIYAMVFPDVFKAQPI